MKRFHAMPFGAVVTTDGVRFRLWGPAARSVEVGVGTTATDLAGHEMQSGSDGWFERMVEGAGAGNRYLFRIGATTEVPDSASSSNPEDFSRASQVIDP